jgi:hypothetical protein
MIVHTTTRKHLQFRLQMRRELRRFPPSNTENIDAAVIVARASSVR